MIKMIAENEMETGNLRKKYHTDERTIWSWDGRMSLRSWVFWASFEKNTGCIP